MHLVERESFRQSLALLSKELRSGDVAFPMARAHWPDGLRRELPGLFKHERQIITSMQDVRQLSAHAQRVKAVTGKRSGARWIGKRFLSRVREIEKRYAALESLAPLIDGAAKFAAPPVDELPTPKAGTRFYHRPPFDVTVIEFPDMEVLFMTGERAEKAGLRFPVEGEGLSPERPEEFADGDYGVAVGFLDGSSGAETGRRGHFHYIGCACAYKVSADPEAVGIDVAEEESNLDPETGIEGWIAMRTAQFGPDLGMHGAEGGREAREFSEAMKQNTRAVVSYANRFQSLLLCQNIEARKAPAGVLYEGSAGKKGYSYHVLSLAGEDGAGERRERPDEHSGRASPRLHMRRGHVRRYADGKHIWIAPTMVGDPEAGVVEKDYDAAG